MRYPDDEDAKRLNAKPWQVELLTLNPSYCSWGPHEDYMIVKGDGWGSPQTFDSWAAFGPWNLDDLNECANFYFSLERASEDCKTCGGDGYHTDAHEVTNSFYAHMNPLGVTWADKITQDECDALIAAKRVPAGSTAAEVNAQNAPGARGMGHDAINRSILIEARLKRIGLPSLCPACEGHGYVYTAPEATVSLTLWWMHPRKGCSRGIEVHNVTREDIPPIVAFLRHAAQRNAERFGKLAHLEAA